jgi:hypothetical protein
MHGVPLSSESAGLAFLLQVELEMRRRAYEEARSAGKVAFLDVLDADYQAIDIIGCLESLLCKLFTTARTARCIRQSLDADGLSFETSVSSTINAWLMDKHKEPKETMRECLEAVLSNSDLAVCLNTFTKSVYHKVSLKAHPDKTVNIRNLPEKALLESIFRETNENCIEIRKFLFTGSEDDPLVSSPDLDRYRRVVARSMSSLQTVNQAREANVQRLANCAWAELFRGEAEESSPATEASLDTQLTNWIQMTTTLQEYVDPSVLSGVQAAHEIAPDAVEALVVATVEARKSGDDSGAAELALLQLAFASGAHSSELVEMKGCVGRLVTSSFPEVHNALYPKLGEEQVALSEEASRVLTLVRTVEEGNKAEAEIARMDAQREECNEVIVTEAEPVVEDFEVKQMNLDHTRAKMRDSLGKYRNKVFGFLKVDDRDEETFFECLKLFTRFAPDQFRSIISDWDDAESRNEEFVLAIRKRFVDALSDFSYPANQFFSMDGQIKSTIIAVQKSRELKAAGSGRRSNGKAVADAVDKHALPSAAKIAEELLKSNHAVFTVRSSLLSSMKKEDRDACVINGYKYKIRDTFIESGSEFSKILVFRQREMEMSSSESCSGGGGVVPSYSRDYILFDYRTISSDGDRCTPFGMTTQMFFDTTSVPIGRTKEVKRNGQFVSDGVSGRNKRSSSKRSHKGSTKCEISELKSFVNARHDPANQVLPLVGVVKDGLIVEVWSGDEREYRKIVNRILRENNCIIFGSTEGVPSVYDISLERKESKSSISSRFVTHSEDDLALSDSELAKLQTTLTPQDELKRERDALKRRELDEDDDVEQARLEWLEERVSNPVDEAESKARATIFSALATKVLFPNIEIRDEIIQALKIGFREWTHPDDLIAVTADRREIMEVLGSLRLALLTAFNNNHGLFQKMVAALERFFANPRVRFEEDEDGELVAVKPREANNYTPVADEHSFYKSMNPQKGKKSKGHVSVGGGGRC